MQYWTEIQNQVIYLSGVKAILDFVPGLPVEVTASLFFLLSKLR